MSRSLFETIHIVIALTLLWILPASGYDPFAWQPEGFEFSYVAPEKVTITGYTGPGGNVTIPYFFSKYDVGYSLIVVSIADNAFEFQPNINKVTIGNTIHTIGNNAFRGCSISEVVISSAVRHIGDGAFEYCSNLYSINCFGDAPTTGISPFAYVPGQVRYIPGASGWGPTFGGALTSTWNPGISPSDFDYIVNSNNTVTITDYTGINTVVDVPIMLDNKPVTVIGERAFRVEHIIRADIPEGVTSIEDYAFEYCYELTNVTLPSSLTNIGKGTFYFCDYLPRITLPENITEIKPWTFSGCNQLEEVYCMGDAPTSLQSLSIHPDAKLYYFQSKDGWGPTFRGTPTEIIPEILLSGPNFGMSTNGFNFSISGTNNISVVIEASSGLINGTWTPISTNTLRNNGTTPFTDPQATNYPGRYYRITMP